MSIFWLARESPRSETPDDCNKCSSKICCVVFDICSQQDPWGRKNIIKKWGVQCEHLREDSGCLIYTQRMNYSWYAENCIDYTCFNIWPLLDLWIKKNDISLIHESLSIADIMQKLWEFITLWSRYQERYIFIRDFLLNTIISSMSLLAWLHQEQSSRENIFNEWMNAHPIDPEFDKKLKLLLSE